MSTLMLLLLVGQILQEPFDDPASLDRWDRMDGATTGSGSTSEASCNSGALLLEGDRKTARWLALTRRAPLGAARWVRVSARMRTQEVSPDQAVYANCNLLIRFDDGGLVTTRLFTGTNDWTTVARRLPVPEGAKEITVGCFLSMPGRAWFDDIQVEAVDPPGWKTARTKHYVYRWLPGDEMPRRARRYNEASYEMVSKFFDLRKPVEVLFFKYPDLDVKEEYTGIRGNAHRNGREIHSIWESDRHEIVHVLCGGWGDPPAILGEGIAVYLSGGWQGKTLPDAAREVGRSGKWVSLGDLLSTRSFRRHSDLVTYPIGGVFVHWVSEGRGKKTLRRLYRALRHEGSDAENRKAFREILGLTLDEANAQLRSSLGLK